MGLFKRESRSAAQSEMEQAAQRGTTQTQADFQEKLRLQTGDEKFARTYRNRGRLYDRIPFSLRTMDIIIYVTVALIVIAIVVGIIIGQ